jgi:membrane-bound metal-dependent hydrolase YbcI (DUF457 family)
MPHAAAHILIPLIFISLFRNYFIKNKKNFPLYYVLIAGIAGILPDIDAAMFWILYFFGFTYNSIHRTFMHTLFIPLIFVLLGLITLNFKSLKKIGKQRLNLGVIFFMIAFGSFFHLLLDAIFQGRIIPFYPIFHYSIGLSLFGHLPYALEQIASPSLDAGLLIVYLIYLESRNRINDFI